LSKERKYWKSQKKLLYHKVSLERRRGYFIFSSTFFASSFFCSGEKIGKEEKKKRSLMVLFHLLKFLSGLVLVFRVYDFSAV